MNHIDFIDDINSNISQSCLKKVLRHKAIILKIQQTKHDIKCKL